MFCIIHKLIYQYLNESDILPIKWDTERTCTSLKASASDPMVSCVCVFEKFNEIQKARRADINIYRPAGVQRLSVWLALRWLNVSETSALDCVVLSARFLALDSRLDLLNGRCECLVYNSQWICAAAAIQIPLFQYHIHCLYFYNL